MPAPSTTAFQRPDLGESFMEFDLLAERLGFIASQVLPWFNTRLQTASFQVPTIESLLRTAKTERASGGGYSRTNWEFRQASFACVENGAEAPVDDRERNIYEYSLDLEKISADISMNIVLRDLEKKVATAVFDTAVWTGSKLTTAVSVAWDVFATAKPIEDVKAAIQKVRESSGMMPNALIIGWEVFKNLTLCDQIIERVKFSGLDDPKDISVQMLAALFGLDRVIVAEGMENTADFGLDASLSDIWGNGFAMLAKLAVTNDLKEPAIGRLFHWIGDGSSQGVTVEQYREEKTRSEIMRSRIDYDENIIYPEAGHLLTGIST